MIYPSEGPLPRNLRGYGIWVQVYYHAKWQAICALTPTQARQVARWMDRHDRAGVRLFYEKLG